MSAPNKTSSELTGGAGFTFEDAVAATYLSALLAENTAAGFPGGEIVVSAAFQQSPNGYPLDDIVLRGTRPDESHICLSFQVKRSLTISDAATNNDFRWVIEKAYDTVHDQNFQNGADRVGAITGEIAEHPKRVFDNICELARNSASEKDFLTRFDSSGPLSQDHRNILAAIKSILTRHLSRPVIDRDIHQLLRHFVLSRLDLIHEGAVTEANAISQLQNCLHASERTRGGILWNQLRSIARDAGGNAAVFDRRTLVERLHGSFRLTSAPSSKVALERLTVAAKLSLQDIPNDIEGTVIARPKYIDAIEERLSKHRFVQVVGIPGTGKSAVLRQLVGKYLVHGPIIFLKADRLTGSSWSAYALSLGLTRIPLESLLMEIALEGTAVVFIDGLDRIEGKDRGIILDVVNSILTSAELRKTWRFVATVRDNGIEPLRTWLPSSLLEQDGVSTVEVKPFDDEEADTLARTKPALRPLLFGEDKVKEIFRRPFFASVVEKAMPNISPDGNLHPKSEVELIRVWWARGGYDATGAIQLRRQQVLIQLARAGSTTLGRRIRLTGFDAEAITGLKNDGILTDALLGHSIKFAHDIFFEWALLQFLVGAEQQWIAELQNIGEPPVLGRVVELLSQSKIENNNEWRSDLERLENSRVRPQWIRAWLLGPLSNPRFFEYETLFFQTLIEADGKRLTKLCVWFQAEKTKANPAVLDNAELSHEDRLRVSLALAWPSEIESWKRCCIWLLSHADQLPADARPHMLTVFEVWQNVAADVPNRISTSFIEKVSTWLEDVEDWRHPDNWREERTPTSPMPSRNLEDYEEQLRSLLLRSARATPNIISSYLTRIQKKKRIPDKLFEQIVLYTPLLSDSHASELVNLVLSELLDELPKEEIERARREERGWHGFSRIHFHDYAIHDHVRCFSPASPLREPFHSLFQRNSNEALRLVRGLANHAVTAWRQKHELSDEPQTPIPVTLSFPWGEQTFWGDQSVYTWYRGQLAPNAVESALMALEHWAFSQVESGRDVDDVLRDVIDGQESCAVLGIASAIVLSTERVSLTTLPLVTCQHIWVWDIRRFVQDSTYHANMIGFSFGQDESEHAESVRTGNARPVRKMEIRNMVLRFLLSPNESLRTRFSNEIKRFQETLPFEYEEEKSNSELRKHLEETSKIWSDMGNPENISVTRTDNPNQLAVQITSPSANTPELLRQRQQYETYAAHASLVVWALESLEQGTISPKMLLEDAIRQAKLLDAADLFDHPHGVLGEENDKRNAVSGVAAVTLHLGAHLNQEDIAWSINVVTRSAVTQEERDPLWSSSSQAVFHPCLFAIAGLTTILKKNMSPSRPDFSLPLIFRALFFWVKKGRRINLAQNLLIQLIGHPRHQISEEAVRASLSLWKDDPEFSWAALILAIRISIGRRPPNSGPNGYTSELHNYQVSEAISAALKSTAFPLASHALPTIPKAWEHLPQQDASHPQYRRGPLPRFDLKEPDEFLRWDILVKTLPKIPISTILQNEPYRQHLLLLFRQLIGWTVDKVAPLKGVGDSHGFNAAHLHEWVNILGERLADISLNIDEVEFQRNFLNPIFKLDDDKSIDLIYPFADRLTRLFMDSRSISRAPIAHLQACLSRVLLSKEWESARSRDGRVYGHELSRLIEIFFFVQVENAPKSERFANGNWHDLNEVMSIIDKFVEAVGDIPSVASKYLTLCERAFETYRLDIFIRQTLCLLSKQGGNPAGWQGTAIPRRIASLIQRFADKNQPLNPQNAQDMLRILDSLVDMGDRRAAALQISESFKDIRT